MISVFFFAFILILLSEGCGCYWLRVLGIERKGYSAPVGIAILFTGLQILYYPAQVFNLSFEYACIVTCIILVLALFFTIFDYKEVFHAFKNKNTVFLLLLVALFLPLLYKTGTSALSEETFSMEARVLSLTEHHFQGYELFSYFISWVVNLPAGVSLSIASSQRYCLGTVFVVISSMLVFNILSDFELHNKFMKITLTLFMLFNGNYAAWNANLAYRGLSWSIFFLTLSVWIGYSWLKSKNEMVKYLWLPAFTAGLSSDTGFGIASIAILYGFMVYLFQIRKIRSFFDLFTFLTPLVVYGCACISSIVTSLVSVFVVIAYALFLKWRYKTKLRKHIARTEEFLFDHYRSILLIGMPIAFMIGSLIVILLNHNPLFSYFYYFTDFYSIDGLNDYLFIHASQLEWGINITRWLGLILLLVSCEKPSDQSIRMLIIVVLILFLNPLCVPLLTYMTGPGFNRTFDVLFNACTETIIYNYVYQRFQWTFVGKWLLEVLLLIGTAITLIGMFI